MFLCSTLPGNGVVAAFQSGYGQPKLSAAEQRTGRTQACGCCGSQKLIKVAEASTWLVAQTGLGERGLWAPLLKGKRHEKEEGSAGTQDSGTSEASLPKETVSI